MFSGVEVRWLRRKVQESLDTWLVFRLPAKLLLRCVWAHYPAAWYQLLWPSTIIHCNILVFLSPPQLFVLVSLLRSGLETTPHPLRPLEDSLHLTGRLLSLELFRIFCICDEAAFLSIRWVSLLYWSCDSVWSLWGLPDGALDTNWSIFYKVFQVLCSAKAKNTPYDFWKTSCSRKEGPVKKWYLQVLPSCCGLIVQPPFLLFPSTITALYI